VGNEFAGPRPLPSNTALPGMTTDIIESLPGQSAPAPVSPLCPSERVVIEKTFTKEEIVYKYSRYLGVDVAEDLEGCSRVQLCRGRESNLRFFWPLDLAGSGRFYEKLTAKLNYYHDENWEYSVALAHLPPKQRVLEVGCGDGRFLSMLKRAGHFGIGLDINELAVRMARSKGSDVRQATLERFADECDQPFDALCAFQVLEHVCDPCSFVRSALRCLREGGLAIFAVPNGEGIFSSLDVALDMPPHHMLRWNGAALQYLTKLYPLVLEDLCLEPMSRLHVGLLADACFNHPAVGGSGWESLRRRAVGTLASKYWSHHFGECRLAGHSLFAVFRKVADNEGSAVTAHSRRGPSGPV
jgi:2-polyprenyl-3-methyl-5-hydroxy-6-metoxy-1,4-benzoquinol methylase